MKLHLVKVYRTDKDKAGKALTFKAKDGTQKPYTRISIKTQEHGDKWLSGFGAEWNNGWQEGQEVDAEVKQNGEYLNFERANPMTELNKSIMRHEQEIGRLWQAVKELQARPDGIPVVNEEIDTVNEELAGIDPDLPF